MDSGTDSWRVCSYCVYIRVRDLGDQCFHQKSLFSSCKIQLFFVYEQFHALIIGFALSFCLGLLELKLGHAFFFCFPNSLFEFMEHMFDFLGSCNTLLLDY